MTMKNDKYGKTYGYERIPLEEVKAGDRIRFSDVSMVVTEVSGDRVTVNDAGWGMQSWSVAAMKARRMKAYRKAHGREVKQD